MRAGGDASGGHEWQLVAVSRDLVAVELDLDALAGGPGRAEDVALKARFDLSSSISICCVATERVV